MREQARHIVTICAAQLRRILVDRSAVMVLVAMPLAIIFVLGISLRSLMAPEFKPEQPFRVAVAASASHLDVVQAVFASRPDLVTIEVAGDDVTARRKVVQRKVDAAAIVPDGFPLAVTAMFAGTGPRSTPREGAGGHRGRAAGRNGCAGVGPRSCGRYALRGRTDATWDPGRRCIPARPQCVRRVLGVRHGDPVSTSS